MSSEDRVLYNIKHYLYVPSVRCGCEVAVKLLRLILPDCVEHTDHERLDVFQLLWIASKIREVVANTAILNLLYEEVGLVEEEDDGDGAKTPVVDDRVKDVDTFDQTIGDAILKKCLVEGAGRHEK